MTITRSTHFTLGGRTDDPFKAELEAFRAYEAAAKQGDREEARRLFEVWRETLMAHSSIALSGEATGTESKP